MFEESCRCVFEESCRCAVRKDLGGIPCTENKTVRVNCTLKIDKCDADADGIGIETAAGIAIGIVLAAFFVGAFYERRMVKTVILTFINIGWKKRKTNSNKFSIQETNTSHAVYTVWSTITSTSFQPTENKDDDEERKDLVDAVDGCEA